MSSGQDIATSIKGRLWNTLFLAFWAAIVAVPLAIILGLIAVRYRNGWVDKLISGVALAFNLLPGILHRLCARLFLRREVADLSRHLDRL